MVWPAPVVTAPPPESSSPHAAPGPARQDGQQGECSQEPSPAAACPFSDSPSPRLPFAVRCPRGCSPRNREPGPPLASVNLLPQPGPRGGRLSLHCPRAPPLRLVSWPAAPWRPCSWRPPWLPGGAAAPLPPPGPGSPWRADAAMRLALHPTGETGHRAGRILLAEPGLEALGIYGRRSPGSRSGAPPPSPAWPASPCWPATTPSPPGSGGDSRRGRPLLRARRRRRSGPRPAARFAARGLHPAGGASLPGLAEALAHRP